MYFTMLDPALSEGANERSYYTLDMYLFNTRFPYAQYFITALTPGTAPGTAYYVRAAHLDFKGTEYLVKKSTITMPFWQLIYCN